MTEASPPLIELRGVSKRFAKSLDLAEKIARKLGSPPSISSSTRARWSGWSANPAAAS